MKRFLLLLWAGLAAAGFCAAQSSAPDITLRLNGRAASATPLELWRGEPVIAEVVLRHPDRHATEPLRIEPPAGNWASRVQVLVVDEKGRRLPWTFVATGTLPTDGVALQPNAVTTLVLRLDAATLAAITPGAYRVWARLDLADGRAWSGVVQTETATPVTVVEAPASPTGAALGHRQLLRVRDALLSGDVPRGEAAARELLRADPKRPEGFVALALVEEAKGNKNLAAIAAMVAASRAANTSGPSKRPANAKPEPVLLPAEYLDLQQRFPYVPTGSPLPEEPAVSVAPPAQPPAPKPAAPASVLPAAKTSVPASVSIPPACPEDTAFAQDPHGQWAASAEASSQYNPGQSSPNQAAGAPSVDAYGDNGKAWASKTPDGGEEWLKLTFAKSVRATAVRVRQTFNPGAIIKVEAFAAAGRSTVVWSGRDTATYAKNKIGWFVATFDPPAFPVNAIKLTLDSAGVKGWNEIDAVQLVGEP